MPDQHAINLYLSPGACSLAPHILLHEVGVPFSTTVVSVKSGLSAEFKRVSVDENLYVSECRCALVQVWLRTCVPPCRYTSMPGF